MTRKELSILKSKLPPKAIAQIVEITGYSYDTVRFVLSGYRNNIRIIDAAIELATTHQKSEEERLQKIKAL